MTRTPLLLLLLLLCAASCDPKQVQERGPVVVGALYNLEGSQAEMDGPSSRGAQLAADLANQNGGVLDRSVELIIQDGASEAKAMRAKTQALFDDHPTMTALIGLSDTDMVRIVAPVAAAYGRLFLTSGATSPRLPYQAPGYLYLACFGDNVQAAAAAEWAFHERGARTASVLLNSSMSYTLLLQEYFTTRFEQLGGEVLSVRGFATTKDIRRAAGQLPTASVVFVAAAPAEQAIAAVQALRRAGYGGPIIGGDGFDSEHLWQDHPDISRVYYTTHAYLGADNPDPKVTAFRDAYTTAYPGSNPDAFAALGYDTVGLLLAAVEHAGSSEPGAVLTALAGLEAYEGVSGTMSYANGGRVPSKSVTILEIDRGVPKLVQQLTPESVPTP